VPTASGTYGTFQGFGNLFTINPFAGVHLIAKRNVFFNVTGGYLFPTTRVDDLKGWRVKAGFHFSLW
jgi:hypothetical protein